MTVGTLGLVGRGWSVPSRDGPPITVPSGPAREAAERELAKPRYHQDDPSWYERLLNWFWEKVGELLNTAVDFAPGGWVGLAVVVLLVLGLIGALWWRLGGRQPHTTSSPALFEEGPRAADDHRALAARYAREGDWSGAVQERMRALVRSLEERAVLEPRPGRTADEAAAEAGAALPRHRDGLRQAALRFDETTYAHQPADEVTYHQLRLLDEEVARTPVVTGPAETERAPSLSGGPW
ncbi:DUF4129 domain-containing protein [Streptomyces sp. NPDC005438]|uniref:DUF4129 domain-containing protein n=1 Tax=Streptomyces sp. NPDC005438 TaxID=3156880 RepID=UPI0033BA4807